MTASILKYKQNKNVSQKRKPQICPWRNINQRTWKIGMFVIRTFIIIRLDNLGPYKYICTVLLIFTPITRLYNVHIVTCNRINFNTLNTTFNNGKVFSLNIHHITGKSLHILSPIVAQYFCLLYCNQPRRCYFHLQSRKT